LWIIKHSHFEAVTVLALFMNRSKESRLIFFGVPPPIQPVEGGSFVKGEKRNS
jgi:hypothetical protein